MSSNPEMRKATKTSKATATGIPPESSLHDEQRDYDWFDAYQIEVDDPEGELTTWIACDLFLQTVPCWVGLLFSLRNLAVRLVGLSAASMSLEEARNRLRSLETKTPEDFPIGMGVAEGRVYSASDREIVAGADDWHLDFRGSIFVQKQTGRGRSRLTATTFVRFKHWFGRLYFLPIKPFHKLIVRAMLARFARRWSVDRRKRRLDFPVD